MDLVEIARFVLALIIVLALIGLAGLAARRVGLGGAMTPAAGRRRRLRVVDQAALDGKHKVVLLRRDDTDHLLLLGPNGNNVIETGIPPGAAAAAEPEVTGPAGEDPPAGFGEALRRAQRRWSRRRAGGAE